MKYIYTMPKKFGGQYRRLLYLKVASIVRGLTTQPIFPEHYEYAERLVEDLKVYFPNYEIYTKIEWKSGQAFDIQLVCEGK